MNHLVEIRSLTLKPGTREEFHRLYLEQTLPLLLHWHIDVVAHGPSLHDEDSYYVIRRFDSLAHREKIEDDFYNRVDWREGPREAAIAMIEDYMNVVLEIDEVAVERLRKGRNIFRE